MKLAKTALATFCFLVSLALCATSALTADFNEIQKLAEQGDADAQYNLGLKYRRGKDVPLDNQKAAEWYRKAAEQGHAHAQFKLGEMYEYGYGVEKNKAIAMEWYGEACVSGSKKACAAVKLNSEESGIDFESILLICAMVLFVAAAVYNAKRDDKRRKRKRKETIASIPEDFKYVYFDFGDILAIDLLNKKMLLSIGRTRKMYDFADIQRYERGDSYFKPRKGAGFLLHHLILHVNDPENSTWKFTQTDSAKKRIDCMELLVSRALDGTLPDTDERRIFDFMNAEEIMSLLSTGTGAQG